MIIRPAEAGDLLAMAAEIGADGLRLSLRNMTYRVLTTQIACSEAYACFAEAGDVAPVAIGGAAPLPDGTIELWFIVRIGWMSPQRLLQFVRHGARRLEARGAPAVCFVAEGNAAGERLARILGFAASDEFIGRYRGWRRA